MRYGPKIPALTSFSTKVGNPLAITERYLHQKAYMIYADERIGLIAIFKPAGVLSHPNLGGKVRPIVFGSLPYDEHSEAFLISEKEKIWLLHRLDLETSGILLCSTRKETASIVKTLFRKRKVKKKYAAIVFGQVQSRNGFTFRNFLTVQRHKNRARTQESSNVDSTFATTYVDVLQNNDRKGILLFELTPKQGITHQLRYQCFANGFPIVGDRLYGHFNLNKFVHEMGGKKRKLYLHCNEISISIPTIHLDHKMYKDIEFKVTSPLPSSWHSLLHD